MSMNLHFPKPHCKSIKCSQVPLESSFQGATYKKSIKKKVIISDFKTNSAVSYVANLQSKTASSWAISICCGCVRHLSQSKYPLPSSHIFGRLLRWCYTTGYLQTWGWKCHKQQYIFFGNIHSEANLRNYCVILPYALINNYCN